MSIFKTSLKVVAAHRLYILVYLVALSLLGLLAEATQAGSSSDQIKQATASVAVIDHDGSTISRGARDYVESVGEARPLEDSRQATQDATVQNHINYILIVPAGYRQRFQETIRQGTKPPRMNTVIGYESAARSLMNVHIDSYLGRVADCLSTLTEDPARTISLAKDTMSHSAPAERVAQDATPLPCSLIVYAKFFIYPIMTFAIMTISMLMASLGRQAVRSHLIAAPVNSRFRNLGVMSAYLVIDLIGWLWIFGLAVAVFGASTVTTLAPLLGVVGAALGACMLMAVSLGFLMGQFGLDQNATNVVASTDGMALSFLARTWASIEWILDAVVQAARLTPGYQAIQAISGTFTATSMSADVVGPLLANCGICVLFAVAIFAVAITAGRTRAQSSL